MANELKPHWILPLKRSNIKMHLIFFDTETITTKENDKELIQEFKLATLNYGEYIKGKEFKVTIKAEVLSKDDLFKAITEITNRHKVCYILSANIWFDLRVSDLLLTLYHNGYENEQFYSKGFTNIIKLVKGDSTIIALNIQQFLPVSVKELGKLVSLPKLDIDLGKCNDDELLRYCARDTDIITTAFTRYLDFISDNDLGGFGQTLSSQALISYRHKFMVQPIHCHHIEEVTEFERNCYYGGRTEIFYQGILEGETFYNLDVNSMYPYVMKTYPQPYELYKFYTRASEKVYLQYKDNYTVMARVTLDTKGGYYPYRYKGKLIFPTGKFTTWLTGSELYLAYHMKDILKFHEMAVYKDADLFSAFINHFHGLKTKYEKEGNRCYRTIAKLIMNSLYGKFGQKADVLIAETLETDIKFEQEDIYDTESGKKYKALHFGHKKKIYEEGAQSAYNTMVAVAATITGYARRELLLYISEAGENNVYYCDTDSLFVNQAGYNNLLKFISESRAGGLEVKGIATRLEIRAPKDYVFGDIEHIKGIKPGTQANPDGSYSGIAFPSFRTDSKRGLDKPYAIKKTVKRYKRVYDKGIVQADGWVKPINFSD